MVIVVVEGPSAAGKTTWCRRHADAFVAEHVPTGDEPDGTDPHAQSVFWTRVNAARWSDAVRLEDATGTAVCDSDPLRLHYSWCLVRIGAAPPDRFEWELAEVRRAVDRGELGFPDLVLVTLPDPTELRRRKERDPHRRRRHFELHRRLAEPLRDWYSAMASLDTARVRWGLPPDGLAGLPAVGTRPGRHDAGLLDRLVEALPGPVPESAG